MDRISRYGKCTARAGKGEELAQRLLAAADALGSDPGCELYLVNRQRDRPDVIWVTELWRDQAALDASLEQIRGSDDAAAVKELVEDWEMIELDLLGGKDPAPPAAAPQHTIRPLTEVEDSASAFGFSETGEARFAQKALGATQTGFSHHRLRPGARQPFGHRHGRAEEVYVVLSGAGRVKLDEEIAAVSELDAIRVSPAVTRAFEAGPDGLELLAFGPLHQGDAELLPGWWTD